MIKTIHPISHANDPDRNVQDYEPECTCCPKGRSGHRIITTEDRLYSLGGYNPLLGHDIDTPTNALFKELWSFSLSTRQWQLLDDFYSVPPTIASHTVAKVGRWLFLFGGTAIPFGETPTSALYRYDLSAPKYQETSEICNCDVHALRGDEVANIRIYNRWHLVPVEGDVPEERYGHTMTMSFPNVYIVGGTSGYVYNSDVYRLDLSGPVGIWTKLNSQGDPHEPRGRYRHETAFDGRILYILGGGTEADAFPLDIIPTFDIDTREWNTLKSFPDPQCGHPRPRKCHSCCQHKNDIYMVGGVSGTAATTNTKTLYDDIWKFSLNNTTWTKYSVTLSVPLYFHSADFLPSKGCIYVFGGVTSYSTQAVRTKRIVSVHVGVADLLELAWETMCECIGNRWQYVDLNELGIPLSLQSRIQL